MKIVALGDVHERLKIFSVLEEEVASADLLIVTGDITQYGDVEKASGVIEVIRGVNPNLLVQVGNLDSLEIDQYLTKEGLNIHGRGRVIDGIGVFGVGGSNITPFHTPVEFSEEELTKYMETAYKEVKDAATKIFVSHTPPFNTAVDKIGSGVHVGSKAVREFIEKYQPDICFTGHIHESSGEDMIGKTKVLNPGPFYEGGYIVATVLDGKVEAELMYYT